MKDHFSRDQSSSFNAPGNAAGPFNSLAKAFNWLASSVGPFVRDYVDRHRHPVNAALHIVGVPAVAYGIFRAATGRSGGGRTVGLAFIVFGYFLQYLGHKRQGNEVGEVSLIKFLIVKLREASLKCLRSYSWSGVAEDGEDKNTTSGTVSSGKNKGATGNGNGNGNGHKGGGNGSSAGRYILWWKTSH